MTWELCRVRTICDNEFGSTQSPQLFLFRVTSAMKLETCLIAFLAVTLHGAGVIADDRDQIVDALAPLLNATANATTVTLNGGYWTRP